MSDSWGKDKNLNISITSLTFSAYFYLGSTKNPMEASETRGTTALVY